MSPYFRSGTLPLWRDVPIKRSFKGDIDRLTGSYKCERTTTLAVGDAVPGFAGMIIMGLEERDNGISREYAIDAEGSLDNTSPTKILSRSESRSLGPVFETFVERRLTWIAGRKNITGNATTDVITATAHGYSNSQRVVLLDLTGGSGLTGQSTAQLGTVYYVRDATSDTFKLAATDGGAAIDFTTNITAGYVLAAEYCPGTPHPDYPTMYLTEVRLSDNNTSWRVAECQYSGMMWSKPFHRVVTCNGAEISPSSPIYWDVTDGWADSREGSFRMPHIQVRDTYVTASALPTTSIPLSSSEGGTPPGAPSVRSFSFTGSASLFRWRWPNGWSIVDTTHVDTLSGPISLTIWSVTYEHIIAQMFK